jgi:hypothetical protein
MEIKKIEEALGSNDPVEIQRALGFAVLALYREMRNTKQESTAHKRAPVDGDILPLYCKNCGEKTEHVFRKLIILDSVRGVSWTCGICGSKKMAK